MLLSLRYLFFFAFAKIASSTFGPCPGIPSPRARPFNVYWNVPTFMCHKYGLHFTEVKRFGIHLNTNDTFDGDKITILYNPGLFPSFDTNNGFVKINGGIPQNGDLALHLRHFQEHLRMHISNESFSGIGVIDFEDWRPIFRQNWASLEIYKVMSLADETDKHYTWDSNDIRKEARRRFEESARTFMEETLKTAKQLRPKASWGYYGFPYCYNETPRQQGSNCDGRTVKENDEKLSWLFTLQDAYMPSVYLRSNIEPDSRAGFVKSRVEEALRLAKKYGKKQVLPYYDFKYQNDQKDIFVTREDSNNALQAIADSGASGFVIWGSSNDTNSLEKCFDMRHYLLDVLGPKVKQIIDNSILKQYGSWRNFHAQDDINDIPFSL